MSMTPQTILASRPAAMVLALSLVAGLTAPFVMLPRAKAAAAPPATCSANNANGCTELSPTPPEDTVAVPPNMMLMLDDSGSMQWNFMPDICYLNGVTCSRSITTNNDALIDSSNNGVYYNPAVAYTPPPQANGTAYPTYTDMTNVPFDAFGVVTGSNVNLYTYNGNYDAQETINSGSTGGSIIQYNVSTSNPTTKTINNVSSNSACKTLAQQQGADSYSYSSSKKTCTLTFNNYSYYFQYSTGAAAGPYTVYYVAPAAQGCGAQPNCVLDSSSSGLKDANGNTISVGQNIANWFAYYHTRINMAKSGLMTAFNNLNPNYRFGFGSIDGNNDSFITGLKDSSGNKLYVSSNGYNLAVVQPFGAALKSDGSNNTGSQRYNFWNWIANESANNGTPLQTALQSVGMYYQTSQPWSTMSSDPGYTTGSTTQFACRAAYTIMTTDGFWNGGSPGVGNVDGKNGPTYSPPAGKTYKVTGYVAAAPYSDSNSNTLADVAMYYWENDLQTGIANEVAPSTSDPAFWQHMTTFTMGLGFSPTNISGTDSSGNAVTVPEIFAWAQGGAAISGFSWPTPASNSINNIADLAHAAVNGHGDFFSVKSPQDLAAGFAKAISEINARTTGTAAASVNASVIAVGAVGFGTSYNTGDWSGQLEAAALQSDGSLDSCTPLWNAASGSCPTDTTITFSAGTLDTAFHSKTGYTSRAVYTDAYNPANPTPFTSFQFTSANVGNLDATETAGLKLPTLGGGNDTLANRINYLLGDNEFEGAPFRARTTSILGAIIHSQPVYVGYPTGNYFAFPSGTAEATAAAASTGSDDKSYDSFVTRHANRAPTVYVGANDGMLHAFNAPVPQCTGTFDANGNCTNYAFPSGSNPGQEDWAFIPRAVYANLGNLTGANFQFRPTVDATPVTRDVFFSESGHGEWHTLLAGGVGLGGRGVYALDITGAANSSAQPTKPTVQWEFDSDMTAATSGCKSNVGSCNANDLGYTVSQPNIGRLANGTWVVLVPNGYFPDCSTPDFPTADVSSCQAIAAQAPGWSASAPYSAVFVLDAQTGAVIAELKTPQISGVTSFGLATPVMGDYQNDQIDDVAFAGDAMGNLWRFDLSSSDPSAWTVTLAYNGNASKDPSGKAVIQPITSMPRLFPDPTTNRFMVVFGTGRFLGVGDNSNTDVQALYGVRDQGSSATSAQAFTQANLVQQYLHESSQTQPDGTVATLRCVTGSGSDTCTTSASGGSATPINAVPASAGGWYIDLQTKTSGGTVNDAGERVVVNPGAIFASNTVVFETLITGAASSDPCSPSTVGSIMALNALTGGSSGVSSLGGGNIAGGRINNARTSGSLPLVSALGGGQVYLPGTALAPTGKTPLSIDAPIWRRRSWNEINQNQ
jgi:type IV pilus assembly protein PilY1